MKFLYVEFIFIFTPLLFVLSFLVHKNRARYEQVFSKQIVKKLLIKEDKIGFKKRAYLLLVALFFFTLSLARPVANEEEKIIKANSTNLFIALEISTKSNLKLLKKNLTHLISFAKNTNIGMVVFSKNVFLVSPSTKDKNALIFLLNNLDTKDISKKHSNIAKTLTQIDTMFDKKDRKNILLIAQKNSHTNINSSVKIVKKSAMNLIVVALKKDSPKKNSLKELSKKTNAIYLEGFKSKKEINRLKNVLKNKNLITPKDKKIKTQKELFIFPLILGLIFTCSSFYTLPRSIFLLPILFLTPSYGGVFDFLHVRLASKAIKEKNYEKAIKEYHKLSPSKELLYNKAAAYYMLEKYDKSIQIYKKINTKNRVFQSKVLFNKGNAYVKLERLQQAMKTYKLALKLNPNDEDIKRNISYIKNLQTKTQEHDKKSANLSQKLKILNKDEKSQKHKELKAGDKGRNLSHLEEKNKKPTNQTHKEDSTNNQKEDKAQLQKQKELETISKKWETHLISLQPKIKPIMLGEKE